MKSNVAEKVLSTAATTMGKGLGEAGLGMLLGDVSRTSRGGSMSGLVDSIETAAPVSAPNKEAPPARRLQVDPWAVLLKWGGPLLVVGLGLVGLKAAWSWASTAGKCSK
jgi:hypothetical protein